MSYEGGGPKPPHGGSGGNGGNGGGNGGNGGGGGGDHLSPTEQNFFSAVLQGLGLPVTRDNLLALYSVSRLEGYNNRYNPLNSVVPQGNSTQYNSVGVQDYQSFDNGVAGTIALLRGGAWNGVVHALKQGNSWSNVLNQFAVVYQGWDPGVNFPTPSWGWGNTSVGAQGGSGNVPTPSGNGGNGGSGSDSLLHPNAATYQGALGPLAGILQAVPELQDILNQAISGGWTIDRFINNIQNSNWYRDHSATAREMVALQASDPAEYQRRINRQKDAITTQIDAMGVHLNGDQMNALALDDLIGGWDVPTLQRHISAVANYGFGGNHSAGALRGNAASAYQQLTQVYAEYGVPVSAAVLQSEVKQMVSGQTTIDSFKQRAITSAKSMYPGLAQQIDSGMTVRQIADPYIQQMGTLLETNANDITLNNPLIKRALQGSSETVNGKTTTVTTPLWQFENQIRKDPRWQYTQNAHDSMASTLMQVGQDWGFE